jgi:hypothetical protein
LTIGFAAQSQDRNVQWSVDEFTSTNTSGTHGSGAIVQSVGAGTASGATTSFAITLAALGSSNNVAMGFIRLITRGSGFTELSNKGDTNGTQTEAEWKVNTTNVNWTWASETVVSAGIAIEIKAATQ